MKTFSDLVFTTHRCFPMFDQQAIVNFDNGYGISVINGQDAYCDGDTFEVAIVKDGRICYDTPLTCDVLGYQTPEDITDVMKTLQQYERNQY